MQLGALPDLAALGETPTSNLSVDGQLIDSVEDLSLVIGSYISAKMPKDVDLARTLRVECGCARAREEVDATLRNISSAVERDGGTGDSKGRFAQKLQALLVGEMGYCVRKVQKMGHRLRIRLGRMNVVRHVTIRGNWPIFEEEFSRRLYLRPGQRLPGSAQTVKILAQQEERLRRFLRRRGYFKGGLTLKMLSANDKGQVNVDVRVHKGRSYKIGEIQILPLAPAGKREKNWIPAIPRSEITKLFRRKILFYRPAFNTDDFKRSVKKLIERYHRADYPAVRVVAKFSVLENRPSSEAIRVVLRIQERKRISVAFSGNRELSDRLLKKNLTLFTAGAYDDYEMEKSAEAIRRRYQSEGYLRAKVRFSRKLHPKYDEILFEVEEGERFRIRGVEFSGNRSVPTTQIKKIIRTRIYPFWGLADGGYLTPRQLRQDESRIAELYRGKGFSRVKVSADIAPHKDLIGYPGALSAVLGAGALSTRGDLFVRFSIDEGPRMRVGSVAVQGAWAIPRHRVEDVFSVASGAEFSTQSIKLGRERVLRLYANNGFPYARVRVRILPGKSPARVNIAVYVQESHSVRIGSILLRGNYRTRVGTIRSALELSPGEIFSIQSISRAERSLRQLGVFDSVRIQVLGLADRLKTVPIIVHVEERYDDLGAIEVGIGASTDNLYFGSLGYTWSNVFGFASRTTLRGEFGPEIQSTNLNFHHPRPLGTKTAFDVRLFVRNQVTNRLGELFAFGGALSLSRDLSKNLRGLLSYEIRQIEADETLHRSPGSFDEGSDRIQFRTRTAQISSTLVYDRRDSPLMPTRGYRLLGALSWAAKPLAGTADFIKIRLNGQGYLPLPLGTILAIGTRYDHGFPLAGSSLLPRVERFFAGGDTTIRGYEEDEAFFERVETSLTPVDGASVLQIVRRSGDIRLLTNIEFLFPILKESPLLGLPLLGAVFFDSGFVANSWSSVGLDRFRHGVGLAVRLVTLVGFLSLEYAWPLKPRIGDPKNGRVHFNFGFVF